MQGDGESRNAATAAVNSSMSKTKHMYDSIGIDEIISSSQKYANRVRRAVVPNLDKPMSWA